MLTVNYLPFSKHSRGKYAKYTASLLSPALVLRCQWGVQLQNSNTPVVVHRFRRVVCMFGDVLRQTSAAKDLLVVVARVSAPSFEGTSRAAHD